MANPVGSTCSSAQIINLGAIDPKDAVRANAFLKEIEPKVSEMCKAEAKVEEATKKFEAAKKAAFEAGAAANQDPSKEGARLETQKKLRVAIAELDTAKASLEKLKTQVLQAKVRFLEVLKTNAPVPMAVRLQTPKPTTPVNGKDEGVTVPERTLKEHQVAPVNTRFKISAQEKNGLRNH